MALEELHNRLHIHFKRLHEARAGGRAFLIEHPLTRDELSSLQVLLRDALQQHRWEHAPYWNQRYLPVLVAAAEVGYRYEGAGTVYWAHLEEWLDCPFDHDERHTLSRYFKSLAEWTGVSQPDTPWARQFCHISWPIAHAVFPVALHQPLFQSVRDSRLLMRADTPAAEFLPELRGWASRRALARLVGFLSDEQVACDIIKAFLFRTHCPQVLSAEAMSRFKGDLIASRVIVPVPDPDDPPPDGIRVPRQPRTPPLPPPPRQPPPRRFGTLVLVDEGDSTSLYLDPPPLAEELRDEALRLLRNRGVALRFLEGGARLHPTNLLGGARLPVTTSLPLDKGHQEHPILAKLSDVDLDATQLRLNLEAMVVDLRSPVLLSDEAGADGEARQVRGRFVRRGASYRLLFPAQLRLPPLPPSIARCAPVAGMDCLQVADVDEPAMAWLAPWGIDGVHRPTLRLVGHPTVERRGDLSAGLILGDTLALDLSGGPVLEEGGAEPLQDGLWLVALPGTPGDLRLRLRAPDGPMEEVQVRVSRCATHRPPLLRASLEGAGHTVDALRTAHLALRLDADLPLEGLSCAVKLRRGGEVLARAHAWGLPALPTVVGAEHPVWAALRGALDDAGADPLDLEVHVGALAVQRWRLEPLALGVWWHATGDGEVKLATELGGATQRAWLASSPLQAAEGGGPADAGVRLLQAVDEAGVAALGSGVCVGPSVAALGSSAPARPARLFRALTPTQATTGAGALSLLQAWQRWHIASATSPIVDWQRREVAAALSMWSIESLCGEAWAPVEAACAGEAAGHFEVDLEAALRAAGIGVDTYAEEVLVTQVGPAAVELVKRTLAAGLGRSRWLLEQIEAGESTEPSTMLRLEEVMNRAYAEANVSIQAAHPEADLSEAEAQCCIQEEQADEVRALLTALKGRKELRPLLELVYPPGAAEALAAWPYVGMDVAALSAELTRWLTKVRRGAPVRWELPQVGALLGLWLHPAAVTWEPATLTALEAGLQDRFGARAIRYVALRAAAALHGGAA